MKKFARVMIAAGMCVLCLMLSACGNRYRSHYSSTVMITTNAPNNASVSFDSFKGTYVMRLRNSGDDEVFITYEATLGEGNIKVYYDFNDEKLSLFEIGADSSVEGKTETFVSNKTIYLIIESDGKCNAGSFSFALEKS